MQSATPNEYVLAYHLSKVGFTRAIGEDEICNSSRTMMLVKLSAQQDKDRVIPIPIFARDLRTSVAGSVPP